MGVLSLPGGGAAPSGGIGAYSIGKVDGVRTEQETFSRMLVQGGNSGPLATQRVHFTFFQAEDDLLADTFAVTLGGTAAGATPTGTRLGLYTVPSSWSGNMECVAACADDTALLTGTTFQVRSAAMAVDAVGAQAMPLSYQLVEGDWYAFAVWVESAAAMPTFYAMQNAPNIAGMTGNPRISAALNGQTDLPLTVALTSLSTSTAAIWAKLTG